MADKDFFNFDTYLREDLERTEGLRFPVKASWWDQLRIRKLPPRKIHANPTDDFCSPEIGPNYPIIEDYVHHIMESRFHSTLPAISEPLIIEKTRPDGYMLLDGHHRWAAALKVNLPRVPVKLVNMTNPADIVSRLERSTADMRATVNLDDVVFCTDASQPAEKRLPFPFSRFYKERIRLGIPALFLALRGMGYDVWVYTSGYASTDYIERLFRHYHVQVYGIVNGYKRLQAGKDEKTRMAREMMAKQYRRTLHIDTDSVVLVRTADREFEQKAIECRDDRWSSRVISIARELQEQ